MAAPNQLILSGQIAINGSGDHFGRLFSANVGFSVTGGTSSLLANTFVTTDITAINSITATRATINGPLSANGSLVVSGNTSLTNLSAGASVFNSSITLGSILMTNGQVKVSNSQVNNDSLVSPFASITNVSVPGTMTTNILVASTANIYGDSWQHAGQHAYKAGTTIVWRNPTSTQNAVQMSVDATGLFYCNLNNNDGTFKSTLWRVSAGPGTSDPDLTIGPNTIFALKATVNGELISNGILRAKSNVFVDGGVAVVGTGAFTGLVSAAAGITMGQDSRVFRTASPTVGAMYFGNSDKAVIWDSVNWIIRGGSLYASNLVSDGNLNVAGQSAFTGAASFNAAVAAASLTVTGAIVSNNTIQSSVGIFRSRGADGNAALGRYFFGTGDTCIVGDAVGIYFNRPISMGSFDITAKTGTFTNAILVRETGTSRGVIYFGPTNNYSMAYDGGATMFFSNHINVAQTGTFGGNINSSATIDGNQVLANYIQSRGSLQANYILSATDLVANRNLNVVGNAAITGNSDAGTMTTNTLTSRGDIVAANLVYGNSGGRFRGGETWIDNGGNFSRIVMGSGRGFFDWDGSRFTFNKGIYSNGEMIAQGDVYALGILRGGSYGGGTWSIALFGDGNGNGQIASPTGRVFVPHLSTLSINTQGYDINTGAGVYRGNQVYMNDYVRAGGDVYASTFQPNNFASVVLTGDGTGNGIVNAGNGNLYLQNVYSLGNYARSDERLKNISDFMSDAEALSKVLRLQPIQYNWKDKTSGEYEYYGFSAQQVESVDDMLIVEKNDDDATKHIATLEMIPLLVASIKELKREIEALKAKA